MHNLYIIRSFEPAKGEEGSIHGYDNHPARVRESVALRIDENTYQEVGAEGYWEFNDGGFFYNYMGRGGIAWIAGEAPEGTNPKTPDKFYPITDPFPK